MSGVTPASRRVTVAARTSHTRTSWRRAAPIALWELFVNTNTYLSKDVLRFILNVRAVSALRGSVRASSYFTGTKTYVMIGYFIL